MNLPNIPTDSFYKFLAISGLIVFLLGGFLLFKGNDYEYEQLLKQFGEERILEKEIEILADELMYNTKYKQLNDSLENIMANILYEGQDSNKVRDSITKVIQYNLPDSIQNKIKHLLLIQERLEVKREFIESHKETYESYIFLYFIALFGGESAAVFGFILWYNKLQKPVDDERTQKETQELLKGEHWAEHCQSCLKTFLFIKERGFEHDGTLSKLFCKECYADGSFVEPELSYEDASDRLKAKLIELQYKKRRIRQRIKKLGLALRWKRMKLW